MEAEVILELRRDLRQHLDVGAGGEELVARAAQHDDVDVVVHASAEDALIQLAVHFVGISVRGGIVQLEDRDPFFDSVIDQISGHLGSFVRMRRAFYEKSETRNQKPMKNQKPETRNQKQQSPVAPRVTRSGF